MSHATLAALHDAAREIREELATVIVGQQEVIEQLLVALLAGQHCLLEAAPGSAKNRLVAALAKTLGLDLHRVHCTPDLEPLEMISLAVRGEQLVRGGGRAAAEAAEGATLPHMLLVDDIARLPPASRVAIQQAMLEGVVDVAGRRLAVPAPFIVLATKYRREDETADVAEDPRDDRFMLKIAVRFPSYHDEFQVTDAVLAAQPSGVRQVADAARLVEFQQLARGVVAPPHVIHYALRLVRSTRVHEDRTLDFAYEWIGAGAGPRASHHLLAAAKMRAAWSGRDFAGIEDVQAMIHATLRHRLVANQNARANGITPDRIIDRLVYEIPVRIAGDDEPAAPGDEPTFDVASDDQWKGG